MRVILFELHRLAWNSKRPCLRWCNAWMPPDDSSEMGCAMVSIILSFALMVSFIALIASLIDMLRRDDASHAVVISGAAMVVSLIATFGYIAYSLIGWYL